MARIFLIFILLRITLGSEDKITIKEMNDNAGLLPFNLGTARIQEYTHTLIHYYDLNPLISEINAVYIKSKSIKKEISLHQEQSVDVSNYLRILSILQDRVEIKIKEILPHPKRSKRGLINGIGSIFKAVTGNLDATDGERYEKLIADLQHNQNKLGTTILKENSISENIIKTFNNTIQQISYNQHLLETKINQITNVVQKTSSNENSAIFRNIINQLINVYEIIDSTLQDIENSIAFSKLNTVHPSIIKTEQLYIELLKIQKLVGSQRLPLEVSLETTLLFEKLIKLDCYIINNKITYLLRIPITQIHEFNYLHLYSIPIRTKSQFKVIIPHSKYLLKNELHFAYRSEECQSVTPQYFICPPTELQEISDKNPCTVNLLESAKKTSTCQQVETKISRPIMKQLDGNEQFIFVLPNPEVVKLQCPDREENKKLSGTYLLRIPNKCQVRTTQGNIVNNQQTIQLINKPILFPDFNSDVKFLPTLDVDLHLPEVKFDELYQLKAAISDNNPDDLFLNSDIAKTPSVWTIILYLIIALLLVAWTYKHRRCLLYKKKNEDVVELQNVQLHL